MVEAEIGELDRDLENGHKRGLLTALCAKGSDIVVGLRMHRGKRGIP